MCDIILFLVRAILFALGTLFIILIIFSPFLIPVMAIVLIVWILKKLRIIKL